MPDNFPTVALPEPHLSQKQFVEAEDRLKDSEDQRIEVKRKVAEGRFDELDTPQRRHLRVVRVQSNVAAQKQLEYLAVPLEKRANRGALAPAYEPTFEAMAASELTPLDVAPTATTEDFLLEQIIGGENFLGVSFFELGRKAARAVARIEIRTPDGGVGSGTGSLVGPQLLLTNHHVLRVETWAERSRAVFDYEDTEMGTPRPTVSFALRPDLFFVTDPLLDFTIVAVDEMSALPAAVTLKDYGFNPLDGTQGKVNEGEPINIVQHPGGLPKQIAVQNNRILKIFGPTDPQPYWLHYETDTLPGSSGAPLFNNQWEVVGLHHASAPRRDANGNILRKDGTRWQRGDSAASIDYLGNEGVRISQILERLRARRLDLKPQPRALLDGLLNIEGRGPHSVTETESTTDSPATLFTPTIPTENSNQQSVMVAGSQGNSMKITIPLHIEVTLGTPVHRNDGTVATPPQSLDLPASPPKSDALPLRELEDAPRRPYYDETTDQQASEDYYAELDLENLRGDGPALYRALSGLLESTHNTHLPYKPARHLYPWVDLQPNLKLLSLYTGEEYEPEQILSEALRLEASFDNQKTALSAQFSEGIFNEADFNASLDILEEALSYNCEHSVPQSWFRGAGSGIPKGDLHHLFTCDSRCNSFRGNVPFFDFADWEETVMENCGRREVDKFEPKQGKGCVARAVFYFLLRYPKIINNSASELEESRLAILRRWHEEEPVSLYERHRNAAIFAKQGNRNPFIDHPTLANDVDLAQGLG